MDPTEPCWGVTGAQVLESLGTIYEIVSPDESLVFDLAATLLIGTTAMYIRSIHTTITNFATSIHIPLLLRILRIYGPLLHRYYGYDDRYEYHGYYAYYLYCTADTITDTTTDTTTYTTTDTMDTMNTTDTTMDTTDTTDTMDTTDTTMGTTDTTDTMYYVPWILRIV